MLTAKWHCKVLRNYYYLVSYLFMCFFKKDLPYAQDFCPHAVYNLCKKETIIIRRIAVLVPSPHFLMFIPILAHNWIFFRPRPISFSLQSADLQIIWLASLGIIALMGICIPLDSKTEVTPGGKLVSRLVNNSRFLIYHLHFSCWRQLSKMRSAPQPPQSPY